MRLFAVIVEDNPTFATIFNGKISINFMLLDFALPGVTSEVSGVQLIIFIQIIIHEHIWCLFGYVLCPRMIKFMVNFTGSAFFSMKFRNQKSFNTENAGIWKREWRGEYSVTSINFIAFQKRN
jgi:hypothetical protein